MGVPVLGYKSENLAAFYSSDSGLKLDYAMKDEKEIALAIKYKREMHLDGGILISNPIPSESAIDNDYINKFIDQAILDAKANNITGKELRKVHFIKNIGH